jgi:putative SOS response-associated peptidase YedK
MCNLYSMKTRRADLACKFRLSDNRMVVFGALPAIFPGGMAPIIKQSDDGERELVMRRWGFILLRDGCAPKRGTNARDDKVQTKFWKNSFGAASCPRPPSVSRTKASRHGGTGSLSKAMSTGLVRFRRHLPPVERADQDLPNALTSTINHERSPVLLTEEAQFATWLTGTEQAMGLITTSDPDRMRIVQSGFEKKDLLEEA